MTKALREHASASSDPADAAQLQQAVPPAIHRADADALEAFLKDRDVACPKCNYNLRDLTSGRCPECRLELQLELAGRPLRIGWFVVTVIPGCFVGLICALVLSLGLLFGFGAPEVGGLLVLGVLDVAITTAIIFDARSFMRKPLSAQAGIAAVIWTVHLLLLLFLASL